MSERTSVLTKKDLNKAYWLWYIDAEMSNSYERMQAPAFCNAISDILVKLYPDKEDLSAALKRHLDFFNSEGIWGVAPIMGVVIAMEEEKAQGNAIDDAAIVGIKTGLMGPLAGVGDTIDWGTIKVLMCSLGCAVSANGSPVGAFFPFIYTVIAWVEGYYLFHMGYNLGATAIGQMLASGVINELIDGASILGLFMMGALSANTVKLSTPIVISAGETSLSLQEDILDGIVPGILPLIVVLAIWRYMKRGKINYALLILVIVGVSLLGSLIGLF